MSLASQATAQAMLRFNNVSVLLLRMQAEPSLPQDELTETSWGFSRMVSAATWVSTRACGRLWQVLRSPGADLHHSRSTKQAVSYHFSSHKPRHRDKPRLKACLYGRATARSLGAPPEQLLRGHGPSLAILSEGTKPSGQLTCAWDAAKSLQPVPNHSVIFINIKKHIHNYVNSEMGIAQVQPSRCNTASA